MRDEIKRLHATELAVTGKPTAKRPDLPRVPRASSSRDGKK